MSQQVEQFYDEFSSTFVGDYVRGNRRCERQHRFFTDAIAPGTESVLVVGCGSGLGAHYIATRVAPRARILAVDISAQNIALARALYPHPRIEYRKLDVITEPLEGQWDVITFPDVYEHIPRAARAPLHARLNQLLAPRGRVVLTVPTPAGQAETVASGGQLQIVDEPVTLPDVMKLAEEVRGTVGFYALVSIWRTNDYAYAVVERGTEACQRLAAADRLPIKGHIRLGLAARAAAALHRALGLRKLGRWWRRRRVSRLLAGQASTGTPSGPASPP